MVRRLGEPARILATIVTATVIGTILLSTPSVNAETPKKSMAALHPERVTSTDWWNSTDAVVLSRPSVEGLDLFIARESALWAIEPLATIRAVSESDDDWIGYHCVTGSGRYAAVVLAPRFAANSPLLRDRGAFAYSVALDTGAVTPLFSGVSLKYFNPGCGRSDVVAFSRSLGTDQEATEVVNVDLGNGRSKGHFAVQGQLTSAIAEGQFTYGVMGNKVVRVGESGILEQWAFDGTPFSLRPAQEGIALLVAQDNSTSAWVIAGGFKTLVGRGKPGSVHLFGAGDEALAIGLGNNPDDQSPIESLIRRGTDLPNARWTSLGGKVAVLAPERASRESIQFARLDDGRLFSPKMPSPSDHTFVGRAARLQFGGVPSTAFALLPDLQIESTKSSAITITKSSLSTAFTTLDGADSQADGQGVLPTCAVPRNHSRRQVPQPNASQIDWTIQMATRNLLQGTNARPANYLNTGLAAYSPSLDFQRGQLHGSASSSVPIPPSVIQGTFAQESAWKQASKRALPGVAGNPLIADFYGAGGTLDVVDYANADCGYGLSQVTDPMTTASSQYTANGKTKVALDYWENTSAGLQFLVDKWNQLYDKGITLNGGSTSYLENWYFALWAYNTGINDINDADADGNWGLGWTNNPMNADYPPDRQPFLRTTYADAEHPSDWPYQERVFGWMETPLKDYKGRSSYATPQVNNSYGWLSLPSRSAFCDSRNSCNVNYLNGSLSYCTRADRKCWWHWSSTFATCPTACGTSSFTYSTTAAEPNLAATQDDNYPPDCNADLPKLNPAPPERGTVIVDDLADPSLNVEGCTSRNWSSNGTFTMDIAQATNGDLLGIIDWHQLGAGFGGHTWFTKNRALAADTSHINKGTWTPNSVSGQYNIKAHIPSTGASTPTAKYEIHLGSGAILTKVVDQHLHENQWVSLGNYTLTSGAKVVLTNLTQEVSPGTTNVAFDAMAFVPVEGNVVRRTVDALGIFDQYQHLNSNSVSWSPAANNPLKNMQTIYDWAHGLTTRAAAFPPCVISQTQSCLASSTRQAFARWQLQVEDAGNGSGPRWTSESLTTTQADWLGLKNARLGPVLNQTTLTDPGTYKVHSNVSVEILVQNNLIDVGSITLGNEFDPNSVSMTGIQRTGDTHLPQFIQDLMNSYQTDYGIAKPDLTYSAADLRTYTHAISTADAATGIMPGRALMHRVLGTAEQECVRVKAVSGGSIGYRPMLAQEYILTRVEAWRNRVQDKVNAHAAPQVVADTAESIRSLFFNDFTLSDLWAADASLYYLAPAVWINLNYRVCADGSVRPALEVAAGQFQLADSSFMPDLYLYVGGLAVDLSGNSRTCSSGSRSCAASAGDFNSFTKLPGGSSDPWGWCGTTPGLRQGNPWDYSFAPWDVDQTPDRVKFCDEADPSSSGGYQYGDHY